ncbi:hypothetical protein LTR85_009401 [Meristemomyces frigidus]|nr:hypothetical protein LTR85_009401 [Meristemomyces frigidus]
MASPTDAGAIESALAKPDYVPAGITAALLEQNRDRSAVIAIIFVGALVYVIMALRCYARIFFIKHFGLDDWLACLTLIPYTAFIALCIVLIHLGSGRHFDYIEYAMSHATTNMTEILDFAAHIIYTSALLICRLSGLAFYYRIAGRHPKLHWCIRGAAAFMIIAYLPQLFLIIFHCLPVTGLWPYAFQSSAGHEKCLSWGLVYVTNTVISLVCDMILFTIPTAILTLLKISLKRKLLLACVLMPGLLVIGLSTARMYFIVESQWEPDESWVYDPFLAIEVAEIGSTLIALSIPALKPFFGTLFAFLDRHREQEDDYWIPPGTIATTQLPSGWNAPVRDDHTLTTGQSAHRGRFTLKSQPSPLSSHRMVQRSGDAEKGVGSAGAHGVNGGQRSARVSSSEVRQDSDPSVGSDLSQRPIIEYQREYTVTHEKAEG